MKTLRIAAMLLVAMFLFATVAFAADFVPSIGYKDSPELVLDPEDPEDDDLILTPVGDLEDEDEDVPEEIENDLNDAMEDLKENKLEDLIEDFEEKWDDITDGAPYENAIISEVFDLRFIDEITISDDGKEISFDIEAVGLEYGDSFVIIAKPSEEEGWKVVNFSINEDGIITIEGTTKTVYAIVRDSAEIPEGPDGPATGVSEYLPLAVIGAVIFGAGAVFCAVKLGKRNAA